MKEAGKEMFIKGGTTEAALERPTVLTWVAADSPGNLSSALV